MCVNMSHGFNLPVAWIGWNVCTTQGGRKYNRVLTCRCSVRKKCDLSQKFAWHKITLNVVSGQFVGAKNDGTL